jgi:hypothetical protein
MRCDPSVNSNNHYVHGAVADWRYCNAAGIDATPLDAGFRIEYLHPVFDRKVGNLDFRFLSPWNFAWCPRFRGLRAADPIFAARPGDPTNHRS